MKTVEELNEEIRKAQKELKRRQDVETFRMELRTLDSYTNEEKCKAFDGFFKFADEMLNDVINGTENNDAAAWCFEKIMSLLGKRVWTIYNSYV